MKILFVVNPTSGGNSKEEWMSCIADYFEGSEHGHEWYEMQGQNDDTSLKYWIDTYQPDRVVAVGGDGTLKFLAQNLLYSDMPIAFLPAGSANGMAKELDLPAEKAEAIKVAVEGTVKKMHVVRINGEHISIHLSDLGLNAQLVKYFEQSDSRGMWGYVREAFKVFWRKEKVTLTIELAGKKLEREVWMLVIANARLYGTGIAINPDGSLYDERFELVLLKRLSFFEILKMILKNRPFNKHKVEVIEAEQATIKAESPMYFQVDGEYICECTNLECTIEKAAIDIVTNN
jgi:diacylglycerol kinase family enzyme